MEEMKHEHDTMVAEMNSEIVEATDKVGRRRSHVLFAFERARETNRLKLTISLAPCLPFSFFFHRREWRCEKALALDELLVAANKEKDDQANTAALKYSEVRCVSLCCLSSVASDYINIDGGVLYYRRTKS